MELTQFQEQIRSSSKPVVVDFWAPWCAPCRMTKPILEKLAQEYAGQVDFLPVNADESRPVIEQLRIFGIPSVISFVDGKEVSRFTGAQSEAGYRSLFDALAAGKEIKKTVAPFDRMLRLGAGMFLAILGISQSSWLLVGLGGLVAFLGIYDRCPVWQAISGYLRRKAA